VSDAEDGRMAWRIEAIGTEAVGASDGEPWEVGGLGHNSRLRS